MNTISLSTIASGVATRAKGALYGLKSARSGEAPSWDGRGTALTTFDLSSPITDKSYWSDRYVLCELTIENTDGERIVMSDVVAAVSRRKNIVSTQMVGMDGTVKEYINNGDYDINIVVGVSAKDGDAIVDEYPSDALRELTGFLEASTALSVYSEFLDVFDISSIVVTSYAVSQDTASNYQSVSISAVSDEEYDLYSMDY